MELNWAGHSLHTKASSRFRFSEGGIPICPTSIGCSAFGDFADDPNSTCWDWDVDGSVFHSDSTSPTEEIELEETRRRTLCLVVTNCSKVSFSIVWTGVVKSVPTSLNFCSFLAFILAIASLLFLFRPPVLW